jgi:hypothetical protein
MRLEAIYAETQQFGRATACSLLLSAMVPVGLPSEIWMRTADFIPSNILRNLYSVSQYFCI